MVSDNDDSERRNRPQKEDRGSVASGAGGAGRSGDRSKNGPKPKRRRAAIKTIQPTESTRMSKRTACLRGRHAEERESSTSDDATERIDETESDPVYDELDRKLRRLEKDASYNKRVAPDFDVLEASDKQCEINARSLYLDCIEYALKKEIGVREFNRLYPHRQARSKPASGQGATKHEQYAFRLMGIENKWNVSNAASCQPRVIIVDFTQLPPADEGLAKLEFSQYNTVTPAAEYHLRKHSKHRTHLVCDKGCVSCTATGRRSRGSCCAKNCLDVENGVRFAPSGSKPANKLSVKLECDAFCGCDPLACQNRSLQRGSKSPIAIVRAVKMGWTARALCEYAVGDYISEYIGELLDEPTTGPAQIYDFCLSVNVPRKNGDPRPLVLNAHSRGNESRYFAHSCRPNAVSGDVAINRDAPFASRIGFWAERRILRGHRICFDYFIDMGGADDLDFSAFFPFCQCGEDVCRFPESRMRAMKTEQDGEEKEDEH